MTMSSGIVGIFCENTEPKGRCSISVRVEQTRDELERKFRNEHPNVDIYLDKAFIFKCKGNRTNVETILRAILVQSFGEYTQYENWDNYMVDDYDKFIAFIENVFLLIANIFDVVEV